MNGVAARQYGTRVHQASGMITVQVGCTIDDAIALMSDRASKSNQTLDAVATAVVERRIRFSQ